MKSYRRGSKKRLRLKKMIGQLEPKLKRLKPQLKDKRGLCRMKKFVEN
jgi:hypothetical protein